MSDIALELEGLHAAATEIFVQSLEACRIESAFDRTIRFEGSRLLRLRTDSRHRGGPADLELKNYRGIFIIAIGKAAVPMLNTLLDRMPRRIGVRGVCVSNHIPEKRNWRVRYFEGGHPLPSEGSFAGARAALALLKKARKETLVIFLISGGASALFDLPLDPEISLEDTMAFHQTLIESGAPIAEVNTIRKHFSAVKGGRLAVAAAESTKLSILLPDVPMKKLDALASGPTLADASTLEEMHAILAKYDLLAKFPASVRAFFLREDLPESPGIKSRRAVFFSRIPWSAQIAQAAGMNKPPEQDAADEEAAFRNSYFDVLLSSQDLVEGAQKMAQDAGFHAVIDNSCDDWDYQAAANYLLERFHALRAEHPRCCLISGGEVTVTIDRTPGAGGRNQQFALACAVELAKHPGEALVVLSAGSDGIDGNTRSAGAIADTTTVSRGLAFGYDPAVALAEFNACPLFTALGDTVVTGPTGHNLRDLRLLISGG